MTNKIVNDYQGLALRTLSSTSFLDKDCEKFCTLSQLHGAMGLVTEIREIETDASKQEEIGDCLWFLSVLADSVGMNIGELARNGTVFVRKNLLATSSFAKVDQTKKLEAAAIYMLDCAKASIFYGRESHKNLLPKGQKLDWNGVIQTGILEATNALAYLCVIYKIDIYETMERNIAKLALRYPEKFDTDKASNRDVDKELGVFTGPTTISQAAFDELTEKLNSPPERNEKFEKFMAEPSVFKDPEALLEELAEESVVIKEIPVEDIPADIQEKMDEVGAAFDKHLSREGFRPEIAEAAEELANSEEGKLFGEESVKASKEAIVGNEVEFNAEKLVEAVEETAEQVKADKKKPGRKKNN